MKPTYNISPSLLERWRCLRLEMFGMTTDGFLKSLKVRQPTTEAQSRGTAYHKILEHGGEPYKFLYGGKVFYKVACSRLNTDWVFSEKAARPAIDLHERLMSSGKPYVFEMPHTTLIEFEGFDIQMSMRFDLVVGLMLHEFKTSAQPPTYGKYNDMVQWKCYMLAMPSLISMRYHFFELSKDNSDCRYSNLDLARPMQETLIESVHTEINDMVSFLGKWPQYLDLIRVKPKPESLTGIEGL